MQFHQNPFRLPLVVFLCWGLLIEDASSVLLVGKKILRSHLDKKSLLHAKGLVLGTILLKPLLVGALLGGNPGPVLTAFLVMKGSIGVMLLKKGVLRLSCKILKTAVAAAKDKVQRKLVLKKDILRSKFSAVKNFVKGLASKAVGKGRAIVNKAYLGVALLTKLKSKGLKNQEVLMPYPLHSSSLPEFQEEQPSYGVPLSHPLTEKFFYQVTPSTQSESGDGLFSVSATIPEPLPMPADTWSPHHSNFSYVMSIVSEDLSKKSELPLSILGIKEDSALPRA